MEEGSTGGGTGVSMQRGKRASVKKRELKHKRTLTGAGCFHTLSNILANNEVLLLALGGSGGVEDVA